MIVILILSVKIFFSSTSSSSLLYILISIVNSEYFNRFDKVYSNILYSHFFDTCISQSIFYILILSSLI